MKFSVSWPPSTLSPNARYQGKSFWAKSKAKKDYADLVKWEALSHRPKFFSGDIALKLTFYPPDARKRDLDGNLSRMKPAIDILASQWGIDDVRFHPITIQRGKPEKGGRVEIEIDCIPE